MKLVLAGALVLASATTGNPELAVRAFPQISLAQVVDRVGYGSDVLLTAEIKGEEQEKWYCPRVEWEMPDGTKAVEESDCPPFEKRNECMEDQSQCGYRGWILNPITGQIEDQVKECACTIIGYPRLWRRRMFAPPHPKEGEPWVIYVRLSKNGKVFAYQSVSFYVKG